MGCLIISCVHECRYDMAGVYNKCACMWGMGVGVHVRV